MPDATPRFTTTPISLGSKVLGGGLNTTAGPLHLEDNESSDLQNIDFDKFGSILKRSGYTPLNTTAITGGKKSDGLYWYEFDVSGATTRRLVNVTNGKLYTMADPLTAGSWTDKTGSATITASNFCDFETFNNLMFITNGVNPPLQVSTTGNAQAIPALLANSYTFAVNSITTAPAVGDTYTNNGITYTISYLNVSGTSTAIAGYIVATGSGAPTTSGNLVRATGSGDDPIAYTAYNANVNITKAKYVCLYNNYLFLANVTLGDGTYHPTRIYWCDIRNPNSWLATSWIEVNYLDGQEITGLRVLQGYLYIFKTRSIFGLSFTGDADFPFILPGGGQTGSSVGCVAPYSICDMEMGIIFVSYDGVYIFDGSTSYKLTDKIRDTFLGLNTLRLNQCVTTVNRKKNMVYLSFPSSINNDVVLVWNFFLNSWSKYKGLAPASMATAFIGGSDEQPLFADYDGFVYKMDEGTDDYPLNVETAIDAYYYTNWKSFDDLINKKGIPEVTIYYAQYDATLTFSYSYDFDIADQFSNTFKTDIVGAMIWGVGLWGVGLWGGSGGGAVVRRDLTGRGRVVRLKISNATIGETFRIDGFGVYAQLDTNV